MTDRGRSVLEGMIAKRNQIFQTILGDFPEEQLQVFLQSLQTIRDKFAAGNTVMEGTLLTTGTEELHAAADRT